MVRKFLFFIAILLATFAAQHSYAQSVFPYTESFTRTLANTNGLIFGGTPNAAFLTAGVITQPGFAADANGTGFLRLTSNDANQAGFARSTTIFPSGDGVDVSFEYFTYGGQNGSADGITFFLFDASVGTFQIGAFGGSLGYAQRDDGGGNPSLTGVSGGYLGVGIDEFGNFSNATEGRQGGDGGRRLSSLVLRGSGDGNSLAATNYEFLKKIQTEDAGTPANDFTNPGNPNYVENGAYSAKFFSIAGKVDGRTAGTGPAGTIGPANAGYRKVRIVIEKATGLATGYDITTYITVGGDNVPNRVGSGTGTYRLLNKYNYPTSAATIPANLSFGFAASTGSENNYHEIRNIEVVIPPSVLKVPAAVADAAIMKKVDGSITFNITDNDKDENGNGTLNTTTTGVDLDVTTAGVQSTITVTDVGTYTYNGDKTITFTPVASFTGVAPALPYNIKDNGGDEGAGPVVAISTSPNVNITVTVLGDIGGPSTVCVGSTITATNTTSGGTWTSSTPANATVNASTGVITGVADGTTTISYAVQVGTTTLTVTKLITVNARPTVAAITGTLTLCESGSAASTTQLANATAGGSWSSGNTAVATVSSTGLVTGVAAGTAVITYTTAANGSGCTNTTTATVTVNTKPTVAAITGTLAVCEGGSTTQLANATLGGTWSSSNTAFATVSSTGLVTSVAAGTVTITYTTAANGSGCTNSATATVTVNAKPAIAAITGTLTVCEGGSTTQLANATTGGAWISSNTAVAIVSSAGLVTGLTAGTVTITYTTAANGSGCSSSTTATVTVNARPAVTAITGTLLVCEGGSTTQLANATTGGSWSSSNTAIATVSSTGVVTGVTAGTATITYTTAANGSGCTNSTTATVTVNSRPAVTAITGALTVCEGGSTTQLANSTTGGSWSSSNTAVATVNNAGLVTGVTPGSVTITYTTAANGSGCTNSTTVGVTVNALPTVAAISGASTTSVGSSTVFSSTTPGGVWSSASPAIATVNNSGIVTGVSVGTGVITYTVTTSGCTTSVNKTIAVTGSPASNTLPIIADITKTGTKDTPVPFTATDFTDKFADADPLAKIKIVALPSSGTLKLNGVNISSGQEIPAADLVKITFVPSTGFTGGPVSFQWNGSDGIDYAVTARNVNITIAAPNTAPVAVADTYTITKGGTLTVSLPGVLTNDTDIEGNSLNAVKVTNPSNGTVTLNPNGSFIYIHNGGNSTSDVFTYKVNDGTIDGNTVSVTIGITTVNGPPVVSDLPKIGTGFTPITFTAADFQGKYTDPNSDPLVKIVVVSLPPVGILKLSGVPVVAGQEIPVANLGNLTFEPPVNWSGTTAFGWNGFDGTVYAINPANVTLTVALAGDPTAKIGLAKSLASITPALNASYDVKFIFTAVNYGLNGLENISIKDNLLITFGGAVVTVKNIIAFGNLKANNSFNGSSDSELLLPASKLSAGEQARVELLINVKMGVTGGLFQNTATAEASSTVNGIKVTDKSTNGLKPDPAANNDVSPSDATPIQLDAQPTYVPQGFSPNGDGQNDKFIIQNAVGKHVSLEVYNRWGNRVYKSADYQNDWGGEVTEGFFVGRAIPDGTYYYIIIVEKSDKYTGFITINR